MTSMIQLQYGLNSCMLEGSRLVGAILGWIMGVTQAGMLCNSDHKEEDNQQLCIMLVMVEYGGPKVAWCQRPAIEDTCDCHWASGFNTQGGQSIIVGAAKTVIQLRYVSASNMVIQKVYTHVLGQNDGKGGL
ncbi:hypothetical protein ARMGADRAFT_1037333 [Armillaria gallica]|uniref:Uncharacterized protein n=1 Tax=Armillaria gallica TaxID=47427 RepID=A0A2H3CMF8_ARMGA|nr:hypothetical protein ARMGADRAFT_1037333 [Armillaria gallica]